MTADETPLSSTPTTNTASTSSVNGTDTPPSTNNTDTNTEMPWNVKTVLSTLPTRYPSTPPSTPLPFFHLIERLKTTPRAGWRRFKIDHGESISDHMYRMSILTMLAPSTLSSRLNIPRCTKMALIHDMAESLVGDITPVDGVPKPEKSRREAETMDYICDTLLGKWNGGMNGKEIREIWQEYEDSRTLEAVFVHDVDKMELILQMVEYERVNEGRVELGEFTWVAGRIVLPEMKQWAREVMEERARMWKAWGKEPRWENDTKPKEE